MAEGQGMQRTMKGEEERGVGWDEFLEPDKELYEVMVLMNNFYCSSGSKSKSKPKPTDASHFNEPQPKPFPTPPPAQTGWSTWDNPLSHAMPVQPSNCTNTVIQLLAENGLSKYTEMVKSEDIDITTLATLNEQDLRDLGVKAYVDRRTMLNLIKQLGHMRAPLFL